MLENVKSNLSTSKDKLVPVSFRIEGSTKLLLEHLAAHYGVKTNELIREIFKAFIDEAADDFEVPNELGDLTWDTTDPNGSSSFGEYTDFIRNLFEIGAFQEAD